MMITKKCIICGKEFIPYYGAAKTQKLCQDPECLRIHRNKASHMRYLNEQEEAKLNEKIRQRRKSVVLSRICGRRIVRDTPLELRASTSTMHEECVFRDCVKTIAAGKNLSGMQQQRLYSRGWTTEDVKRVVEGLNEDNSYESGKIEKMYNMRS